MIAIVAGTLVSTGGAFMTLVDTVRAMRGRGLDVQGFAFLRAGVQVDTADAGVSLHYVRHRGPQAVLELRSALRQQANTLAWRSVVSMLPQSDVAITSLPRSRVRRRVSWVQGLPWPSAGEQSPIRARIWRGMERAALARADEVWWVSDLVRRQAGGVGGYIVRPPVPRPNKVLENSSRSSYHRIGWVGRLAPEKNPRLFFDIAASSGVPSVVVGDGPLFQELQAIRPPNLHMRGWITDDSFWNEFDTLLITSLRDAFPRVAIEAAWRGKAVIAGAHVGVVDALIEDEFRHDFVMHTLEPPEWVQAIDLLAARPARGCEYARSLRERAEHLALSTEDELADRLRQL